MISIGWVRLKGGAGQCSYQVVPPIMLARALSVRVTVCLTLRGRNHKRSRQVKARQL